MKTLKIFAGLVIVIGIAFGGYLFFSSRNVGATMNYANPHGEAVDLIGTMTGTTTAGVRFTDWATSTYIARVGEDTNIATLSLKATAASSTSSQVNVYALASSDYNCDTATTSTIYNVPKMDQINWYDVGENKLNVAGANAISNGTTTMTWTPTTGSPNKKITLTDLTTKCLRFDIGATSTVIYGSLITK